MAQQRTALNHYKQLRKTKKPNIPDRKTKNPENKKQNNREGSRAKLIPIMSSCGILSKPRSRAPPIHARTLTLTIPATRYINIYIYIYRFLRTPCGSYEYIKIHMGEHVYILIHLCSYAKESIWIRMNAYACV